MVHCISSDLSYPHRAINRSPYFLIIFWRFVTSYAKRVTRLGMVSSKKWVDNHWLSLLSRWYVHPRVNWWWVRTSWSPLLDKVKHIDFTIATKGQVMPISRFASMTSIDSTHKLRRFPLTTTQWRLPSFKPSMWWFSPFANMRFLLSTVIWQNIFVQGVASFASNQARFLESKLHIHGKDDCVSSPNLVKEVILY